MGIFSYVLLLAAIAIVLIHWIVRTNAASKKKFNVDDFQEQIDHALSLSAESEKVWQNEPANDAQMRELDEKGIRLFSLYFYRRHSATL